MTYIHPFHTALRTPLPSLQSGYVANYVLDMRR